MENDSIVHFIVSLPPLDRGLKYRRHRLAEFLLDQDPTAKIVWIYPTSTIDKSDIGAFAKSLLLGKNRRVNDRVMEVGIPDPFPSLTRFSPFIHNFSVHRRSEIRNEYASAKKVLWFTYPAYSDMLDLKMWDAVVYDCSDYWINSMNKGVFKNLFERMLERSEDHIINNSDLIFATSEFLKERVSSRTSSEVYLVEHGIEFNKFYSAKKGQYLENIPHPRLGYVGGLKPKINFPLLQKMADKHPEWSIIIIGPEPYSHLKDLYDLVSEYENVHWIKGVATDIVPEYMKELDVGLLPYKQMDYNKAIFPLKFFEYMGCGLPMVGCGLPSTEKYSKENVYIHTEVDDDQFIEACEKAVEWSSNEETRNMRIQLAKDADWGGKFNFMLNKVKKFIGSE